MTLPESVQPQSFSDLLFFYKGRVVEAYDGDTCRIDIDLGFSFMQKRASFRLFGINAPEMRGETLVAAKAARDHLLALTKDKEVYIDSIKDKSEKYGRYLCILWVKQDDGSWLNVNDAQVQAGHAVPYSV